MFAVPKTDRPVHSDLEAQEDAPYEEDELGQPKYMRIRAVYLQNVQRTDVGSLLILNMMSDALVRGPSPRQHCVHCLLSCCHAS